MAGHSQFKNIMHRKGAQDAKKAKVFTKLLREITVACSAGAVDPESNPRLRAAIQAAKQANVPKGNIERAIQKATDSGEGQGYESLRYEGFGPGSVALIVDVLTDNRNRTASEIRMLFHKKGGRLGEGGSVSFLFEPLGCILYPAFVDSEAVSLKAIDAGALDVDLCDEGCSIFCAREDLYAIKDVLEVEYGACMAAELIWRPHVYAEDFSREEQEALSHLIEVLQDHEDVQSVWSNDRYRS